MTFAKHESDDEVEKITPNLQQEHLDSHSSLLHLKLTRSREIRETLYLAIWATRVVPMYEVLSVLAFKLRMHNQQKGR